MKKNQRQINLNNIVAFRVSTPKACMIGMTTKKFDVEGITPKTLTIGETLNKSINIAYDAANKYLDEQAKIYLKKYKNAYSGINLSDIERMFTITEVRVKSSVAVKTKSAMEMKFDKAIKEKYALAN